MVIKHDMAAHHAAVTVSGWIIMLPELPLTKGGIYSRG
jgi:hypothetical protein